MASSYLLNFYLAFSLPIRLLVDQPTFVNLLHAIGNAWGYRQMVEGGKAGAHTNNPKELPIFRNAFSCLLLGLGGGTTAALLTGRAMSWLLRDPTLVPIYLLGYILVFFSPNDVVYKALDEVPYFSTPFYQGFFHHVIDGVSRTGAVSGVVDAWRRNVISASRETRFVTQGMPFKNPRVPVLPQIFLGTIAATFGGMWFKWWFVEAWASPSCSLWVVCASVAWYVWAVDPVGVLEPFVQGGAKLIGAEEGVAQDFLTRLENALTQLAQRRGAKDAVLAEGQNPSAMLLGKSDIVIWTIVIMSTGFILKPQILLVWDALKAQGTVTPVKAKAVVEDEEVFVEKKVVEKVVATPRRTSRRKKEAEAEEEHELAELRKELTVKEEVEPEVKEEETAPKSARRRGRRSTARSTEE
ncbi:hypothetical protein BJ742DRAFT_515381 [Cladochytrium replicatum]|nr:hypothetical protein BJ742DRAFT_515381 [Cladochytrium replicatum]